MNNLIGFEIFIQKNGEIVFQSRPIKEKTFTYLRMTDSIPLPDFDFDDDISFSFDTTLAGSPPLAPNCYIIQQIESFGFALHNKEPLKCTSNSMVFCAEAPYSQDFFALKMSSNRQRIITEFENAMKLLQSPYIVKYYDLYDAGPSVFLQMELCELGDITMKKMNEIFIWKLIHDVGSALDILHNSGFMHMDVSPSNILLTNKNLFKLGDFGSLCEIGQFETGKEGAGPYVSPETLLFPGNFEMGKVFVTEKTDIFSFGLVLLEAATGCYAPRGGSPNYSRIRNDSLKLGEGPYQVKNNELSQTLINLINKMLSFDPDKRPSAAKIASHPWAIQASKM